MCLLREERPAGGAPESPECDDAFGGPVHIAKNNGTESSPTRQVSGDEVDLARWRWQRGYRMVVFYERPDPDLPGRIAWRWRHVTEGKLPHRIEDCESVHPGVAHLRWWWEDTIERAPLPMLGSLIQT